jgi:hypothetical protein
MKQVRWANDAAYEEGYGIGHPWIRTGAGGDAPVEEEEYAEGVPAMIADTPQRIPLHHAVI